MREFEIEAWRDIPVSKWIVKDIGQSEPNKSPGIHGRDGPITGTPPGSRYKYRIRAATVEEAILMLKSGLYKLQRHIWN